MAGWSRGNGHVLHNCTRNWRQVGRKGEESASPTRRGPSTENYWDNKNPTKIQVTPTGTIRGASNATDKVVII